MLHDAIEDISSLLGRSRSRQQRSQMSRTSSQESLTGGVGTTFYRAPEQERCQRNSRAARQGKDTSYDMKADIYSLGVVLFELFADPFPTYMERAETLSRLRGEDLSKHVTSKGQHASPGGEKEHEDAEKDWNALATERFPETFRIKAPEPAQKIILWCLRERPDDRPSAKQLLSVSFCMRTYNVSIAIEIEINTHRLLSTLMFPPYRHCPARFSRFNCTPLHPRAICSQRSWSWRNDTWKKHCQ